MIGDYKIGKLIGEGAFSKVKLGIHNQTGKKVAIKIINKKLMQESNEKSAKDKAKRAAKKGIKLPEAPPTSPTDSAALSFINNLENEVQLLMRLDHPNVIKTYQVIDSEEECYVVMQYASGGEMMEYLAVKGCLTEKEAKKFFAQLVSGMEHIHLASIVHRDMKLENLLLDDKQNLLITDFGLGRTYDSDRMHLLDTFCGTPHYAAVELISGIPYIGIKSDIWALGVILYFLVVGTAPFTGSTIAELYENIRNVRYDIYDFFSPELTDILDKILQKNPIDRITLQEIRNHKWLEGYDCPIIPPKISGKVDSSKLGQIVKSINSEKSYICYTFNNYEAPVNRHLANSRIDATRRQRSNSAISARKKSYSIGKDARPALDTILGKDARLNPEVSVGRGSISGRDFRPAAESSAGANSVLSKDGRPMAEDSMRSNFISMNSSVESDFNGSKPFAESSVGRGGILVDKQWCESSPVEASPLRIKSTEEEAPAVRGPLSIRGALGFRRGSFSRKIAVPLRQDGSFISKAVPTSPREGMVSRTANSPENCEVSKEDKEVLHAFEPARERLIAAELSSASSIIKASKASLQLSKANLATLDNAIQSINATEVKQERRRRAVSALPAPEQSSIQRSPVDSPKIIEDENEDQPTRLLSLTKKTFSPPRSYQSPGSTEKADALVPSMSAAYSIIASDSSKSGNDSNGSIVLARRLSMVGKPQEDNTESSMMDGETAKLKLENFQMEDIIAWHETHKPPKEIRTVKFAFRKGTSSSVLDTATMFQDVHKALMTLAEFQSKKLKFKRTPDYYNFTCTYSEDGVVELLKFDVEICKVWLLDLHAVKMKRRGGDALLFKKFYDQIVKELKW